MTESSTPDESPATEAGLRRSAERTREELGNTVQELAARTDVTARAKEKAGEMRGRAAGAAHQARDKAARTGHVVQEKVHGTVRDVQDKAPDPVVRTAGRCARLARRNRTAALGSGAVVLVAGVVLVRRCRTGNG
ncbi:hypothetical protein GCM10009801_20780 [Streptomyces albiaxialis]|uniref:Alanine-rich protein n=1 Tax=Streptomyces albiaxialis TaxID=329523 RepID=A0ABN2VRR9_9ACTN